MTKDEQETKRDGEARKPSITEPFGPTPNQSNMGPLFKFTRESFDRMLEQARREGRWPYEGAK